MEPLNILIPALIPDNITHHSYINIRDQIFVTIYSFAEFNQGSFLILTNSTQLKNDILLLKNIINNNTSIYIDIINFEKEWISLNLNINPNKLRKNFIIAKFLPLFILNHNFFMSDWDIITTGHFDSSILPNPSITTFFNPKHFDGLSLAQISHIKKLNPPPNTGNFRWLNSGFFFAPLPYTKNLIKEYWNTFNNISHNSYKNIILFDTIGDELIYNIAKIDNPNSVLECSNFNINVIPKNFGFNFNSLPNINNFGSTYPYILNVHFSVGHVKPFNVFFDSNNSLHFNISLEPHNLSKDELKWNLDSFFHPTCPHNFTALIFAIIWQYKKNLILEQLNLSNSNLSNLYLNFFYNILK